MSNISQVVNDENLNDIGTVKFRELKLSLQAVSFEQDVLCLAYLKSNFIDIEYKNKKEYRAASENARSYVLTQFLNLDGRIIKANSIKADIKVSGDRTGTGSIILGEGKLKQSIQLRNIPQKGFACFYGDDTKNVLLTFNPAGKLSWTKLVKEDATAFLLLTSNQDVYILQKKKEKMLEGGYELLGYNTTDSTVIPKYILKDKQGNSLKVLSIDNDPVTGKLYIAGQIINPWHGNQFVNANQIARGTYSGIFSIDFTGHKKADIHETYSYWADGSQPSISRKGHFEANDAYTRFENAFRDYEGNTWFAGSAIMKKLKWVSIAFEIVTLPTVIWPVMIGGITGNQKARLKDGMLVKLTPKGALSFENSIPAKYSKPMRGITPFPYYDFRTYYSVNSSDNKTNYLIMDDAKNFTIYNVTQKKVARTIPRKDGNTTTFILPAKEGHIMVSEYNKKEKSTSLSIEAL